ncbi:MAG TPA: tetratricopeptide repeat protein [Blastocatellia bacterium]|nr:tetratricopeptide repeat protein [Blastocatellia bacterium]
MSVNRLAIITLVSLLSCSSAAPEESLQRGQDLLNRGSYKDAIAVFTSLVEKNPADVKVVEGLIRALIETGDYRSAENRAVALLEAQPSTDSVRAALAEIKLETGRYQEAVNEFDRAARNAKGVVWLRATLGQARALAAQGKDDQARSLLQEFIRYYNSNSPRTAEELAIIARGMAILEKHKDANDLFIDAREADPALADALIGQGELLIEKYNYGEAASLFQDALKINPNSAAAHTGLARTKRFESSEEPLAATGRGLAVNPNYVPALVLRAWLDLEADREAEAAKSVEQALAVNPNSVQAMGVRAAMHYLRDRTPDLDAETRRALAINPHAGEFFQTLAHFAVNNRRYADAVEYGRRAVEVSPRLWSARTELGIELLRVGRVSEGRAELERAFAGDPFNVWAKNTLDLLDSMRDYQDTIRGPFLIKSSPAETGALAGYAADLLDEAHRKLTARYRFTPRAPISIEMFANHEDFAVRSLGLPGLGALGVCFGQVIAMDSPSARPSGEFNWGSTLWHEFTHVITLQITDHRIPRWFSEGLSVYEEHRARPGWGDSWSLERVKAYADGRFVKIAELEAAFVRPRAPDQVPLAYFQASLVCDFIEERFGFDAILKMLALYKDGKKTPEVAKGALGLSEADFDRAFGEWVRAKAAPYVEAVGRGPVSAPGTSPPSKEALAVVLKARPNDYFANLRLGTILKKEGDVDRAVEHLRRAAELFPYYAGEGNPHVQLAEIYESQGKTAEAAAALENLARYSDTDFEALKKLARLRLAEGDNDRAIEALGAAFYIHPFDAALHKLAGDVYLGRGDSRRAVREFRVAVALKPPDLAGAHYDVARALDAAGERTEAKRAVLRALEIAPGFEKAQELLLKLRGAN